MIRLTREPIDYAALAESVRDPHCGAVALFLGTVRDLTGDFVTVFLDYEAYGPMAEKKLAEIEAQVRARWPVGNVAMVHRLGRLEVGDVSVAVAVSCPHRGEAFDACRFAVDTLKELVPIWKKEKAPDGTGEWVHQSAKPGAKAAQEQLADTLQAEAILEEARLQVRAILEEGRRDAEQLRTDLLDKAVKEANAERERERRQIDAERAALLSEVYHKAVELATKLAANAPPPIREGDQPP